MKQFFLAALCLTSLVARVAPSPVAPYPHSTVIVDIEWHWDTYTNAAHGSDLWPVTWGPDDNLYAAWGDGGGFGGSDNDGRVAMGFARIEGTPENWRGINVNGGKKPEQTASFPKKSKTAGITFVDGILYALVNLQDSAWPNVNHTIEWSTDFGATWSKPEWLFPKGVGMYHPAVFLNFGKDYTGLPEPLAGYVYVYGVRQPAKDKNSEDIYLARIPRNKLSDRAAWEFVQQIDSSKPIWTSDVAQAVPIFTDTNSVGIGSVTYLPVLKRYLLTSFYDGPGQLGIFDAPTPWGPWTTVAYYDNFGKMGKDGDGLTCSFPQKWMSADGLTLWTIFSVYGDGAKLGINAHDRFNLVKVSLILNK